MDGTALYECVAVIFVSQLYAAANPDFTLTFANQVMIVFLALMVSIVAAGTPHAGLVMMGILFASVAFLLASLLTGLLAPLYFELTDPHFGYTPGRLEQVAGLAADVSLFFVAPLAFYIGYRRQRRKQNMKL